MDEYETEVVSVDTGESVETEAVESQAETVEENQVETQETTNDSETEQVEEAKAETTVDNELVELPDGRKLTPDQVKEEYLKLQSDYTRKSQRLSNYEKGKEKNETSQDDDEPIIETYDDLYENFRQRQEAEKQQEIQRQQELEKNVISQLEEIKKIDPSLDEDQLFSHALKYGFTDLNVAYNNQKDMYKLVNKTRENAVKEVQKRNTEPISGSVNSGNTIDGDVYDPNVKNMSAVEFLNSLNNK